MTEEYHKQKQAQHKAQVEYHTAELQYHDRRLRELEEERTTKAPEPQLMTAPPSTPGPVPMQSKLNRSMPRTIPYPATHVVKATVGGNRLFEYDPPDRGTSRLRPTIILLLGDHAGGDLLRTGATLSRPYVEKMCHKITGVPMPQVKGAFTALVRNSFVIEIDGQISLDDRGWKRYPSYRDRRLKSDPKVDSHHLPPVQQEVQPEQRKGEQGDPYTANSRQA